MASSSSAAAAAAPVGQDVPDYLDEDIVTVPGQVFALVSFVSPTSRQKNEKCAMKIRGVFGTREEAAAHVKKLMRMDNSVDIFIAEMYKWLPVPPDPNGIEDQEYSDKFLNDLMKGYKESQLAAKQHFAERKRAVIEEGLDSALTPEERLPPPTADRLPDVFTAPDPHPGSSSSSA